MDRRGASAAPSAPPNYEELTNRLANAFGDQLMSRDAIYGIVESCEGNLEQAGNAIMSIIDEIDTVPLIASDATNIQGPRPITKVDKNVVQLNTAVLSTQQTNRTGLTNNDSTQNPTPSMSFADVSKTAGTFAKVPNKSSGRFRNRDRRRRHMPNDWTDQIKQIMTYHNQGTRTLILMRGAPGSGKSSLAKHICEMTVGDVGNNEQHIFSTDDFFVVNGTYMYDSVRIPGAHDLNQRKVSYAMSNGVSPIIVDNTNIKLWEMLPYVKAAVDHGYVIEIVEPTTSWAKNPYILANYNSHGVSVDAIKKKLKDYEPTVNGQYLIDHFQLSYHPFMTPPVLRNIPKFTCKTNPSSQNNTYKQKSYRMEKTKLGKDQGHGHSKPLIQSESKIVLSKKHNSNRCTENPNENKHENVKNLEDKKPLSVVDAEVSSVAHCNFVEPTNNSDKSVEETQSVNDCLSKVKSEKYEKFDKILEVIEKVEDEWENGESWDDGNKASQETITVKLGTNSEAKPPRSKKTESHPKKTSLLPDHNDWRMFMPSWNDNNNSSPQPTKTVVETKSCGTCMEIGDWNNDKNTFKVLLGHYEDINSKSPDAMYTTIPVKEKIPEIRMLDKSTTTSEPFIDETGNYRCKNEEKHFIRFRNLFKNVNKANLRDIFDNCCGDVNWATTLVLDGMAKNVLQRIDHDDISDIEEENEEPCDCTAHYDIMPKVTRTEDVPASTSTVTSTKSKSEPATPVRKQTKDLSVSDTSLAIKRQIEESIVISDNHYSQECLRVRKLRRGELGAEITNNILEITNDGSETTHEVSDSLNNQNNQNVETQSLDVVQRDFSLPCTSKSEEDTCYDSDDSNYAGLDEVEKTVSVDIGFLLIKQLDQMFGRSDMDYPPNVEARINIPMSLLNEINALWIESLMHQLETESKLQAEMIAQDEQFARELEIKELELLQSGTEPDVPDFKELMDMEFALSLYQKELEEMLKQTPVDLATMLSRQKLFNLFPTIPKEDLAVALLGFRHDFNKTVESVLLSTDRAHIAEEKNGVNKFIIAEELKRHQEFLEEQKRNLALEDWPALPTDRIDMATVVAYRDEANKHLEKRNKNIEKAREHISGGSTLAAYYYSDIAAYHKLKYEQANGLAAAGLIQYHASRTNDTTLDLHYLRVSEAKEALDLFLDARIQAIRASSGKCQPVFIITGRGLHSNGGPKIKPAIEYRLKQRGMTHSELNAGLLTTKVCAAHKLSHRLA